MKIKIALMPLMLLLMTNACLAQYQDFNYETLLMSKFKLAPGFVNYEQYAAPYMQQFQSEQWKQVRYDEFEKSSAIQNTAVLIREKVKNFKVGETIRINPSTSFQFQEYDFDKNGFPVKGAGETNHWYARSSTRGLPRKLNVFFSNYEALQFFPIQKQQANGLVKSRKSRYGSVDRNLYPSIYFKIENYHSGKTDSFSCRINKVEFYRDRKRTSLLYQKIVPEVVAETPERISTAIPTSQTVAPETKQKASSPQAISPSITAAPSAAVTSSANTRVTTDSTFSGNGSKHSRNAKPKLSAVSLSERTTPAGKPPASYKPVLAFATASPDFRRVAFTAERNDKHGRLAVIDGVVHPEYLIVNDVMFSPDSKRVMYKATPRSSNRAKLYLDGQLLDMGQTTKELQFTPDSKNYVYVSSGEMRRSRGYYEMPGSVFWNGSPTKEFSAISRIRIGGDSKAFTFTAVKNGAPVVVVNNEVVGTYAELPGFPFAEAPQISPDGKRTAYHAQKGQSSLVVADGKDGTQRFSNLHGIKFSPNSKSLAFVGKDANGYTLYKNETAISSAFELIYDPVIFSPNSAHLAAIAKSGSKSMILMDGKPQQSFDKVRLPVFSPDSKNVAHWAEQSGNHFVVVNGKPNSTHEGSGVGPIFSSNSVNIAYSAKRGDQYDVIVNGKTIDTVDEVDSQGFKFSNDSMKLGYWARIGEQWHLCVNGVRSEKSFNKVIAARHNQFDIRNMELPQKLKFNGSNELLGVGYRDNEFFKVSVEIKED